MKKNFLTSLLLLPLSFIGGDPVILIASLYSIYLVSRLSWKNVPSLVILSSILPNVYVLYFEIIIILIFNLKRLKLVNLHMHFCFILSFLPYIIYYVINKSTTYDVRFGNAVGQFQMYLCLFVFFYGAVIYNTLSLDSIRYTLIAVFIVFFVGYVRLLIPDFPLYRLSWMAFPLIGSIIVFSFNRTSDMYSPLSGIVAIFIIFISLVLLNEVATFTVIISIVISMLLSHSYLTKNRIMINVFAGPYIYIIMLLVVIYAIQNYDLMDFTHFKDKSMTDLESFDDLLSRAMMKFYEDRAPIWISVYKNILSNTDYFPDLKIQPIVLLTRENIQIDFDFHSHSLYLELIRIEGLVIGIVNIFYFLFFVLKSRMIFTFNDVNQNLIVLVCGTVSSVSTGSFTGIFPLLPSFAPTAMIILSTSYVYSYLKIKEYKMR